MIAPSYIISRATNPDENWYIPSYTHSRGLNPKTNDKIFAGQENGHGKIIFATWLLQKDKFLKKGFLAIVHQGLT